MPAVLDRPENDRIAPEYQEEPHVVGERHRHHVLDSSLFRPAHVDTSSSCFEQQEMRHPPDEAGLSKQEGRKKLGRVRSYDNARLGLGS